MNRTDAALTRRVIRARLTVAASVLGGTLALAGLGAFGASPVPPPTATSAPVSRPSSCRSRSAPSRKQS